MPLPQSNPDSDISFQLRRIADALEKIAENLKVKPPVVENVNKAERERLPMANPKKTKASMGYNKP
jgi:hypothetical protein